MSPSPKRRKKEGDLPDILEEGLSPPDASRLLDDYPTLSVEVAGTSQAGQQEHRYHVCPHLSILGKMYLVHWNNCFMLTELSLTLTLWIQGSFLSIHTKYFSYTKCFP